MLLLLLPLLLVVTTCQGASDLYAAADGGGYGHQSYGYYDDDDCGDLEILGVAAGGAALAALGVYIIVTQAMMPAAMMRSFDATSDDQQGFDGAGLADRAVRTTCQLAQLAWDRQETDSSQGREGDNGCFSGIVGALAGFAALGALIAYALYLATQAMMARSLHPLGFGIDPNGLSLASRMALLLLETSSPESKECLPYELCQLNQRSRMASPHHYMAVKLASLPVSWYLSRGSPSGMNRNTTYGRPSFLDFCQAMTSTSADNENNTCEQTFATCTR